MEWQIPSPLLGQEAEITQKQRDKLMYFNTVAHWHCYFDPTTGALYNQYCRKIMDNATEYLVSIGMIDQQLNKLKTFEE